MIHSSIQRSFSILALLLLLGSLVSASAQLLPQEQAIANDMITTPGQGRPYLVYDPIIEGVARARAKDMAVRAYFSHVNPDGVAANYLLRQAGYVLPAWWGADPTANYVESIAAGYSAPSDTWNAWMNSPAHKTHLLAQNSFFATETHYGVGYYYDPNSPYQYYWVVITAPPQPIEISNPLRAQRVTEDTIPVSGYTDPAANAASVQFRLENTTGTSSWQLATGTTSWSGTMAGLNPGANLIRAQSLDGGENVLAETTATFTYVETGTLTVTTSGSGGVTVADRGVTTQVVGPTLLIRAVPDRGSIFTGWTGSIVSGSAVLPFQMVKAGITLQANFEPTPFIPVSGPYYGILTTGSGDQTGLVQMAVNSTGLFTGRLILSGSVWSFAGYLDPTGAATINIPRRGLTPLTLVIQADLSGVSGQITGTLTDGIQTYNVTVSQSTFNARTNAAPQAGQYTLALSPDPSVTGSSAPQGTGFASMLVNRAGGVVIVGRLSDGTPFSTAGRVANDGSLAIYVRPRGSPAGSILNGVLEFQSTSVSDLAGTLAWTKGPNARDPFYPAGFALQSPVVGSRFVRPAPGIQPLIVTTGTATAALGGGDLSQTLTVQVNISSRDRVTMVTPGQPDLALAINPITGTVGGRFVMPNATVPSPVGGVILQKQGAAFGYFRGTDQFGSFSLTP